MNERVTEAGKRTFAALRFRNYRLYLISQIVSFSGTWMQGLAQAWLVLELTGSGTRLGTVAAAQFIPTLLFAPYGGVIADRFDKRKLIMATQSIAGLLALTLGILTLTDNVQLWMVYVIAAGFGAVTAVDNPSRQTFVMEMVGPDDVANAVTLNSVVVNAARAIGPALGGVIISVFGIGQCFIFNAFSYLAVIVALHFVRRSELFPGRRAGRKRGQLRHGFRYVWRSPVLRTTIVMLMLLGTFSYEFTVSLPLLAKFTFAAGSSGLAWLTSLMGLGAVVGGLVVAGSGTPTPRRLVGTAAGFGASILGLAVAPTVAVAYVMVAFVGATSVGVIALSNATLQLNSRPELRGRVMSLFSMSLIGSTPIGGPIIGWIGEHMSPRWALGIGAIAAMTAAAYGARHFGSQARSSSVGRGDGRTAGTATAHAEARV